MTAKIFTKLILGVLGLLIVALVAVDLLASRVAESAYIETLRRELVARGRVLASFSGPGFSGIPASKVAELARSADTRLTLIAPDGAVVADSEASPERMENHRSRPEVLAALGGREGSSIRPSPTVGEKFLYVAVPVSGGALRLAVPLHEIREQVNAVRRRMLEATVLAFLPAIVIAAFFARLISSRLGAIINYAGELARGNFRARLACGRNDELGILSRQLTETGEKLQTTVEELERERAELEKLERVRKDFVINVSHELRTPLASIQGYTETLLEGALDDRDNNLRFLSIIRQNAERLGRLVGDLMTLSSLELKTEKLLPACYDVNALLAESVDSMRPLAAKKGISITLEPAPEGAQAFCDSEAIHQVLGNLLDNALKYTPADGSITVAAAPAASAPMLEIHVRDTGVGIPPEELPRLFERFYRVDKARSRELGGTGLGLSIVKHLVRAQGGEVRVASEPGRGSDFSFTVPRHDGRPIEGDQMKSEMTAS